MNQSEFEVNIRDKRQARETKCEQVTIGFYFNWLRKWRIRLQSQGVLRRKQSKHELLLTLN